MNYEVRNFIKQHSLQPADGIIAKKVGYGILDHYIVYIGYESGQHIFMANSMDNGVRYYTEDQIPELIKRFEPTKIRPFSGNGWERSAAVARAKNQLGRKYSLVGDNCEHFANYVQLGRKESPQVTGWIGAGLFLATLSLIIAGNKKK
ncbi:lecithin retinol acyltransferase family protein [Roseivirga thermotolerans]|uniref:lecithin retinol acyltransferase family protein n=1 Tax=Roseivirga thermotolerans TaxID=1758176 RepID=UPI00273F3FF1|nr:lecithin retinol acyltransferase family protein [Roseivirga thermotolerans]